VSTDGGDGPDAGSSGSTDGEFDHRKLDRTIHSRIRLAVLSVLAAVENARFTYLRDQVNTTDGNLSTHLGKLEEAGYIEVEKSFEDRKPVTRYRLTADGREAFREYVDHLGEMLGLPESNM